MADGQRDGGTFLIFLAGAALGAGAALLLAPRSGAETRRALRESLDGMDETLRASLDRGLALLDEAKTRLGEAVEVGREAARREAARLARDWAGGRQGQGSDPAPAPRA